MTTRLSPHFTLEEMCKSGVALRHGIDNTPSGPERARILENLTRLCREILEPVRAHFGTPFAPTSGYRCLELNRLIGSQDTSQHVKGEAVDFEVPEVANGALAVWIRDTLAFDQLILEMYTPGEPTSGWVHCSLTGGANRGQTLTIDRQGTQPGLLA